MEIPLLDLKAQYQSIKTEIDEALAKVVESQYFVLSKEVEGLEEEVAKYCGVGYAAGVASGTDALILSLRALNIGEGDLVITSPFTFFASSEVISLVGAKPLFVDIDPDTYNLDPQKLRESLEKMEPGERSKVKAVIPVHLYGQCADMKGILELAGEFDFKIVEDCCQAIGASCLDKKAGSFGDTGCISFFPSKNLGGFGDGGMVVSKNKELIDRIKVLRVHGSREQYIHEEIGYNSRLDSIQAAILRVKLRHLNRWIEERRAIATKYNEAFSELPLKVPSVGSGNIHTYHQYTMYLEERNRFNEYLIKNGIAARIYYPVPLHLQPCYADLGKGIASFPASEKAAESVVSLPVYSELTNDKIKYIIDTVKKFFN